MNVDCAARSPEGRPHRGARGVSRGQPAPVREIMQRARPALSSEHLCTTGWAPLFTAGKWAPPGTARAYNARTHTVVSFAFSSVNLER